MTVDNWGLSGLGRRAALQVVAVWAAVLCAGALGWAGPVRADGAAGTSAAARFNAGDYQGAVRLYAQDVVRRPSDVGLRLSYAVALLQLKQYAPALEQLQEAQRLAPSATIVGRLQQAARRDEGHTLVFGGVAGSPSMRVVTPAPANPGVVGAIPGPVLPAAKELPKPDASLSTLKAAEALHPDSAPLANLLGDACQLSGNIAGAEEWYDKASRLAPRWTKPLIGHAIAILDADPPRSADLLQAVLRMEPENAQAKLWLGDAYQRMGKAQDALRMYREAEASPQTQADARVRLGTMLLRGQQVPQALSQFSQAQQVDPGNVAAAAGRAQSNALLRKIPAAEADIRQAQQAASKASPEMQAVLLYQKAQTQASAGDLPAAVTSLNHAQRLNPDMQQIYKQMAAVFQRQGTLASHNEQVAQRLQTSPRDLAAMRYLVEGYGASGETDKQLAVLDMLAREDKANAWIWDVRQAEILWQRGAKSDALAKWLSAAAGGYPVRTMEVVQSIEKQRGAAAYVEAAMPSAPTTVSGTYLLFGLARQEQRWQEALSYLDEVIARDPKNPTLSGQREYLLRQLGKAGK